MDADNRHKIPGSETKDFISHNRRGSVPDCQVCLSQFPVPHKAYGSNTKGPLRVSARVVGCFIREDH